MPQSVIPLVFPRVGNATRRQDIFTSQQECLSLFESSERKDTKSLVTYYIAEAVLLNGDNLRSRDLFEQVTAKCSEFGLAFDNDTFNKACQAIYSLCRPR